MTDSSGPTKRQPFRFAAFSILALLIALATVGVVGVIENARLKDSATQAVQYDVAVSATSDDLRVAVMDLRYDHRNIVLSGPTNANVTTFDASYQDVLTNIDALATLDISDLDVPQPDQMREIASGYYNAFRPSIALFTSDPIAFNNASEAGLDQLDTLAEMTEQVNDSGNALTASSLEQIEQAADRERWVLLFLLVGVGMVGVALLLAAARVTRQLQAANETQAEAARQLEESLRMKTQFIADASHELRTPITLIRGNAELSLATAETSEQREHLQEIFAESTRMAELVNDLLFLARSDAGTLPLELEFLPVGVVTAHLVAPARSLLKQRGIEFTMQESASADIRADPARIEQALLILIDNAGKFSPPGESVTLETRNNGNSVRFSVIDHGPGIAEADRERIFDRFVQVRDGVRDREGSGIGLSIARSIVESHNGTIAIEETPGGGATFHIDLPKVSS